jgi:hypothetical protein
MAFSGSGMGSGAAGGAIMGAQMGGPWGAAIGAAGGGLLGAFGGKKGKGATRVNQWLENPAYSWTEGLREDQAGFYGDELARIREGRAPSYWDSLEGSLRDQQQSDLEARYFGFEGDRGGSIMDVMQSAGAQSGIGPRGTNANVTKGLRDYSRERQSIENYITQLRAQEMQNAYNTIPTGINSLAPGPEGQWDSYTMPGTPGSNPGGALLGSAIGSMGSLPSFSTAPSKAGYAVPGMGGYRRGTPMGTYNTGSMSILPRR